MTSSDYLFGKGIQSPVRHLQVVGMGCAALDPGPIDIDGRNCAPSLDPIAQCCGSNAVAEVALLSSSTKVTSRRAGMR